MSFPGIQPVPLQLCELERFSIVFQKNLIAAELKLMVMVSTFNSSAFRMSSGANLIPTVAFKIYATLGSHNLYRLKNFSLVLFAFVMFFI